MKRVNFLCYVCCFAATVLFSCTKQKEEVKQVPTDPDSFAPTSVYRSANVRQLSYSQVQIKTNVNCILSTLTPDSMRYLQSYVYVVANGGTNYRLPGITLAPNNYNYTIKSLFPDSQLKLTRSAGSAETFGNIKIVLVTSSYLFTARVLPDFSSYASVKAHFALP